MKEETRLKKELTDLLNMQQKIKNLTLRVQPNIKQMLKRRIIQIKTILYEDYKIKM